MKIYYLALIFLLSYLLIPHAVSAHPGSLDELGGHFRNKDCVYLLHEPTPLAMDAKNMDELINLIKKYNRNKCTKDVTALKIELNQLSYSGNVSTNSNSLEPEVNLGKTYKATLLSCTDGDTAVFSINGKPYKTRFLFIDTPENTANKEDFGEEATNFTCDLLTQGNILLETDGEDLFDKYDRLLAWVFVDDKLLQEEITKEGLVEDFYDYGTYKYENRIRNAMEEARADKVGLFQQHEEKRKDMLLLIVLAGLISFVVTRLIKR
ncbi:thermonuclease family protein [Bacillus salitolerans]|uniref:Thermonuclease family protein n=1 Tax=Bacillus salitolerans TaxID=1437434 RepID=A0ABW4LPU1_9BACI